ncbi:hypothetical protein RclHR1_02940018 [Rhizophagus clarus]|nr:hypothetical protein RclHR1_02940018 [Rhizophagus clarus]
MFEHDFAAREITAKIGCENHTAIIRLKKKYAETGRVEDNPRLDQSRMLNECNKHTIIRCLANGECLNAVQLIKSL